MIFESKVTRAPAAQTHFQPENRPRLQRKCACGGTPGPSGECAECKRKRLSLQPKLMINQPGDKYEQEADRVADSVVGGAGERIGFKSIIPSGSGGSALGPWLPDIKLTGEAAATDAATKDGPKKKEQESLRRKAADSQQVLSPPAIVGEVLQTPGEPLGAPTRAFMEQHLGHDFSQVRVHADSRASDSARAVNATAYTVGKDIAFQAGQYRPETEIGKRLLAHELAHVVQQDSSSSDGDGPEARARIAGRQVGAGGVISPAELGGAPVCCLQRADPHEEQQPAPQLESQTLESFDIDLGPGRKPWKLDRLSRRIGAGLRTSKQAWIEVIGYFDPAGDVAAGKAGEQLAAARRRIDVTRRALIQWAVPAGRIRTSIVDTSLADPRAPDTEHRQIDLVLHSQAAAPSTGGLPPIFGPPRRATAGWLTVVVPLEAGGERPTPERIFRQPPPPIVVEAPVSLAQALLREVGKDVNKLLDSPIALPAAWVIDQMPADWEVRKKIKNALRDLWKPSTAPPLTDVGTFADPRFRDVEGEEKAAREEMPKTIAKAFFYAGEAAVPAPPRDPVGTTFFIRLPAIPLP
jgi:Domain of unknown function (DUF4157)